MISDFILLFPFFPETFARFAELSEFSGQQKYGSAKICLRLAGMAHQEEGGPIVGVGLCLPELRHGEAEALALRPSFGKTAVEVFHEIRGRAVVHIPQADDDRCCARVNESPHKSE